MIKILVKQPRDERHKDALSTEWQWFNRGCNDTRNAYESCIKVVDIDDMLMRYCMYEEDLPLKERQKEFSEYLLEQIGEK